jgi:prepilin-type N-terminal cleavage/methylation domain-containing protein
MERRRGVGEDRGFTIVEVMIAMFILSFIVGGMAMVSTHAARSSAYADRLARANMIAEAALERSRNSAFESLNTAWTETVRVRQGYDRATDSYNYADATLTETCVTAGTVTTCTQTGNAPYTRTRTVEYRTTGIAATSFTAATTVTVRWESSRGETQQVGVSSLISKF